MESENEFRLQTMDVIDQEERQRNYCDWQKPHH